MSRRRALVPALLLVGLATTAGCTDEPEGGDEPTTARALAAVAAEHAGEPSSGRAETADLDEYDEGAVGAALRYDGAELVLAVGRGFEPPLGSCSGFAEVLSGCREEGGALVLWEEATPEEDAGVTYVVTTKDDDVTVVAWLSGPPVTGYPGDLDLPVPVDTLVDLVLDPRVDVTTSRDALDAGADLPWWDSGD